MLKNRLISCLVLKDNTIVQSIGFKNYLPIGKPEIAIEFVSSWDIDEIILLDISASAENKKPNLKLISSVSKLCFVPLTVGGGIHDLKDVRRVLGSGADKICINSETFKNHFFISEIAHSFGSQCVVVSMDVKKVKHNKYEVFTDSGKTATGLEPVSWAQKVQKLGAGEIFLNSIDRDGSKQGYDLNLLRAVSRSVSIPVITCGGVGKMEHFVDGFIKGKASAVAAANIFHYIEHSTIIAKAYLKNAGIPIRLNTAAKYKNFCFDDTGRIMKKNETALGNIWFRKHKVIKI